MTNRPVFKDLYTAFPFLARLDDDAMACFRSQAVELGIPAGTPIASEGMGCTRLPLELFPEWYTCLVSRHGPMFLPRLV